MCTRSIYVGQYKMNPKYKIQTKYKMQTSDYRLKQKIQTEN